MLLAVLSGNKDEAAKRDHRQYVQRGRGARAAVADSPTEHRPNPRSHQHRPGPQVECPVHPPLPDSVPRRGDALPAARPVATFGGGCICLAASEHLDEYVAICPESRQLASER